MKSITASTKEKLLNSAKNYSLKFLFIKMMCFISAILISRGEVLGRYYPFGLSFSASAPLKFLTPTLIGTAIGYLFPLRLGCAIRYIATVIAITAIKWTLSDISKIKNHVLYTPLVVFFSSLVTGISMDLAYGIDSRDISISILEATLAAGAAYFFDVTFKILSNKKLYSLNQKEFVCVAISMSIVLCSLSKLSVAGVSIGKVLAIAIILTISYIFGPAMGTIAGICSGIIFSLPSFGQSYISGSYAFGGLISGMFSRIGKFAACLAFLFANTLLSFQIGDVTKMISGIYESILGICLFLVLPKSFINTIKFSLPSFVQKSGCINSKNILSKKLKFFSESLDNVTKILDKASNKFSKSPKQNSKEICLKAAYSQCTSCGLNSFCWSKNYESTAEGIKSIYNHVVSGEKNSAFKLSSDFLGRCKKTDLLIHKISEAFSNFNNYKSAELKINEFKSIMSNQFSAVGSVLTDLSSELEEIAETDKDLENKVKDIANNMNLGISNISCLTNKDDKLFIDAESQTYIKNENLEKFRKKISKNCGREMDRPIITDFDNCYKISISEKKNFNVDIGISQHACNNGKLCGDSCCYFEDSSGNFNVIISDGMGTGGSAAAEGAVASELMKNFIKSGISFAGALKMVNSALMLKPKDEFLTTMDIVSLDLFSGQAKFIKAGSPSTFIVREGKVFDINFESLPIGILNEVTFSQEIHSLQAGDVVLMVSDGATDIGSEWIQKILTSEDYNSVQELSNLVVNAAVAIRKEAHDDDISAVAFKISA